MRCTSIFFLQFAIVLNSMHASMKLTTSSKNHCTTFSESLTQVALNFEDACMTMKITTENPCELLIFSGLPSVHKFIETTKQT